MCPQTYVASWSTKLVLSANLICAQVYLALYQLKIDKYIKCRIAIEAPHQSHLEDY